MQIINARDRDITRLEDMLKKRLRMASGDCLERVKEIVDRVREEGDRALFRYTLEFDGVDLRGEGVRVPGDQIKNAYSKVSKEYLEAVKRAAENIARYHSRQRDKSWFEQERGILIGQIVRPLDSVGIYVPGGTAAYPSSVLMNAIPARVAGVERIVMITPPNEKGIRPEVLVAASEAGVGEIYRAGGAQGIAALAYGTQTIPKVDKIVGPGNIFVALAKKMVFGDVGIDMIAGPSEILVIADSKADPALVAADMLSQAEHDPMASSILVTDCEGLITSVQTELKRQVEFLPRKNIIQQSLRDFGALVLVRSIEEACSVANLVAPEHLELMVESPLDYLGYIKNAGAIFMGQYSPEPLGDYLAGPNHVLPTGGASRFGSPLSVEHFLKKSSLVYYSRDALEGVREQVILLAETEGLQAHGNAIKVRFREHG